MSRRVTGIISNFKDVAHVQTCKLAGIDHLYLFLLFFGTLLIAKSSENRPSYSNMNFLNILRNAERCYPTALK